MNSSNKLGVKQSVATLKAAYGEGSLKGHPLEVAVTVESREVLASWGSAMRK